MKAPLSSFLCACIFSVYEIFIAILYFKERISLWQLGALHVIALLAIGLLLYWDYRTKQDTRYSLLLFIAVFGTGPFGAVGFVLQSIFYLIFIRISTPPEIWFKGLFPDLETTPFTQIFRRVVSHEDDYSKMSEVPSFRDLFAIGTREQKQAVLDLILRDFNPSYLPILKQALADPANLVRIEAAAAVKKVERDFERALALALEAQQKAPDDDALLLKVAISYDKASVLVEIDPLLGKTNRENAIRFYREYLKKHPDDRTAQIAVGRLLYAAREDENYLVWAEEYRKRFKDVPGILESWVLEALYRLHRYDELADWARKT